MDRTWIVVAHRGGAKLFEAEGKRIKCINTFDNPEGSMRPGELNDDKQGQTFQSSGPRQHRLVPNQRVSATVADGFAKQLAEVLEAGRVSNEYERLALIAAPRFLGRLREALSSPTSDLVVGALDKNLQDANEDDVAKYLEDLGIA